jgi:dTDP-4-amino-4,6-dideoxygalactose transaminase
LLVGSGTIALQLALAGVRVRVSPRPVALPAYACFDIATAAEGADVAVVLYDIDPTGLCPDDASFTAALRQEPAAVVVAHMYGYPVDMERVANLCRESGAVVIEDAAQGSGGELRGVALGSFGSLSVLSFGRGKGRTAGAGGALLAHDEVGSRIVAWARTCMPQPRGGVREAVMLGAQWALARPETYGLPSALPFLRLGETVYHPPGVPTAMSAASLRALAVALTGPGIEVDRRRDIAERFIEKARQSRRVRTIEALAAGTPGYLRLPLRTTAPLQDVVQSLAPFGVAAAYPAPLSSLPSFAGRVVNAEDDFTGARTLAGSLFTFPTHTLLQPRDITALERWLN